MHEVTEPPKKGSPNPWIVVVLSALSLCLLLITVTDGLEADKNEKALAASRTEAAQQRTLLQGKVDVLTAEHAAASRASAQRLATAEKRIAELTAELDRFKVAQPPREILFPKVDQAMSDVDRVARKPALLAHAIGANEGLTSVNAALNAALAEASSFAPAGGNWDEINKRFLEKLGFEKSVTMTASGLRFKVISYGNGPKPNATSTVKCLYTGKLIDGRMFDSTKNRNNEPAEFPLNAVIPAWNEGIQYVGVGGKIILYAPPHLAYGALRTGPIPPHSVLIFEIELVEITK
jgi:FKBP-type peptidyl-prolyl cis-trans isomerase